MDPVAPVRPALRPRHRSARLALAGLLLASTALLGACSGRDGGDGGGPVPVPSETTVNTVPPGGG